MELTGHCCWDTKRIFTVMNADAEYIPDELFLAVHTDYPVTLVDPNMANRRGGEPTSHQISSAQFLEQFLDPSRRHVQAVVMGESGAGKSHFIKWLALNIPRLPNRRIIVIPRAGLSLRNIVVRLIEELPVEKRAPYQARLTTIGYESADRTLMREQLCNSIAIALRGAEYSNAMEQWLAEELPNLFYDPQLRLILNDRRGVIEDLVDHIFQGPQGYQRLENKRLFREEDLPLRYAEIKKLSVKTQGLVRQLQGDGDLIDATLKLINQNLNKAIAQALNFTGDQLIELMHDVRRGLKAEGQSLILLIEDFARLQGIDGALLQALIEAASPENGLCELRWAMAVTRGYYEQQVPATVQTRMHFVIDMDVPTNRSDGGITSEKVVTLAARYLNAVRVTGEELTAWNRARAEGKSNVHLPNRCIECPSRMACHETFGHVDGFGLYPFTENAVLNMVRRRDMNFGKRFNPRVLITHVLRETLGDFSGDIAARAFPSRAFLERMGGSKLPPTIEEKLRVDDPAQFERRLAVASLWGSQPDRWEDLPGSLYKAFGLTPPPSLADAPPDDGGDSTVTVPKPKSATEQLIEQIQAWGRGGTLQDAALNRLRGWIKEDLDAFIDWDQLGIQPSSAGFVARSINFVGQLTSYSRPAGGVMIVIPLDADSEDERRNTSIALEGMVRFREQGNWQFPDGAMMLESYAEALRRWADYIIARITEPPGGQGWDPVAAAAELLTIGSALSGIAAKDASLADWVDALFQPASNLVDEFAPVWRNVVTELNKDREPLQEIVRSRASGMKGGAIGPFIDPTPICGVIERVRRTWKPTEPVPVAELQRLTGSYKALASARKKVDEELRQAVQQEIHRRSGLAATIFSALPEGYTWEHLVMDLRGLVEYGSSVGVSRSQKLQERLTELLAMAENVPVADALAEVADINNKDAVDLAVLGQPRYSQVLQRASALVQTASQYLDDLESGLSKDMAALGEQGDLLDRSKEAIARSLSSLECDLRELEGNGNA